MSGALRPSRNLTKGENTLDGTGVGVTGEAFPNGISPDRITLVIKGNICETGMVQCGERCFGGVKITGEILTLGVDDPEGG